VAAPEATTATVEYLGGQVVRRYGRSWRGVCAQIAEIRGGGHLHVALRADQPMLSVALEEVGGHFAIEPAGRPGQSSSRIAHHALGLIPARLEACGRGIGMSFFRHLVLELDGPLLANMLDEEVDLTETFTLRPAFSDPRVMHLAQLLADECATGRTHSRLYCDALSTALLLALARLSALNRQPSKQGQLALWQLRRVTDYLVAHLAEDVRLQTLADLVKLSRSYFSRAFKMSTGLAPHQWLLHARIARAKELLLESNRPLAQIAVDIGFVDQAHFTRTFGRTAGESPRAWQRARCG
jgi:AraC-like DNA-binding protein